MKIDHAARARALVGTRFRLQGRGPDGLDCVGVALAACGIPADAVPRDYALRSDRWNELGACLERLFRRVRDVRPGDVMLLQVASDQPHLAVRTAQGFVHADVRIGRVVETPGEPQWPLLSAWRRRRKG